MASYKRNKSGGSQSEGTSNSASPASSVSISNPISSQGTNNNAPKYGTLVPNRIFVGGISSNTTEAELSQLFSKYGNVKATKIIADRAGVSKGYGFVTFESEDEVKLLFEDANNISLKERRLNIAPAIKKQIDVFVGQPTNRSFDTSSPPPTTPNLYFHNGVPYTFHNGMAFFPPSAHQTTMATMPPTEPSMYTSYGPAQNSNHTYGTPMLLPGPPLYMPQNYSYQPIPMTNGGPAPIIYPNSGTSNNSGPVTSDNAAISAHLPTHLYPQQQYLPQEAFYPHPFYISYSFTSGDYEFQDQQIMADMMPQAQFERSVMVNPAPPRWGSNSPNPIPSHQTKRLAGAKRPNASYVNSFGSLRPNKKGGPECLDKDTGGGGDAPLTLQMAANNTDVTSKMQSLALGGVS